MSQKRQEFLEKKPNFLSTIDARFTTSFETKHWLPILRQLKLLKHTQQSPAATERRLPLIARASIREEGTKMLVILRTLTRLFQLDYLEVLSKRKLQPPLLKKLEPSLSEERERHADPSLHDFRKNSQQQVFLQHCSRAS